MVASKMEIPAPVPVQEAEVRAALVVEVDGKTAVEVKQMPKKKDKERKGEEGRNLQLRPGYMYREANWEIGRAAERAKIKVRAFKPRDRWTAWRKATIRNAKIMEKKGLGRSRKK